MCKRRSQELKVSLCAREGVKSSRLVYVQEKERTVGEGASAHCLPSTRAANVPRKPLVY